VTRTLWVLLGLLVLVGCPQEQVPITQPQRGPICQLESHTIVRGFSYDCANRDAAKQAHLVCELMVNAALELVYFNGEAGPTTGENLYVLARIEDLPALKVLEDEYGQDTSRESLRSIREMAEYVAQRNITDRTTYPFQVYDSCVKSLGFAPVSP
jgi:hypothetical protein